jgi:RimJ/RimL family protein N-acetyltransferase
MPHERLQEFVVIDYTKEMAILATVGDEENQEIVGVGRYFIDENKHAAEVAFAVRDDYHNKGIGTELLSYLTYLAKRQGLLGFTAEVLADNKPMLNVFENGGFDIVKHNIAGIYEMTMAFKE